MPSSAPTRARSVLATNCTASPGSPAAVSPAAMIAASTRLLSIASRPPRSTQALPLLRHSAAISIVTLGRFS